ncbi:hypothetical protein V12B01_13020 [Vibrio splendidus 12B01]|nr:hypothetical protein V12B01_13020 [Vibrio splendidus 12B01]
MLSVWLFELVFMMYLQVKKATGDKKRRHF